jgi:hypothetical protein
MFGVSYVHRRRETLIVVDGLVPHGGAIAGTRLMASAATGWSWMAPIAVRFFRASRPSQPASRVHTVASARSVQLYFCSHSRTWSKTNSSRVPAGPWHAWRRWLDLMSRSARSPKHSSRRSMPTRISVRAVWEDDMYSLYIENTRVVVWPFYNFDHLFYLKKLFYLCSFFSSSNKNYDIFLDVPFKKYFV